LGPIAHKAAPYEEFFVFYIMCYSVLPIPVLMYWSRLTSVNKDLLTYLLT